MAKSQQHVLVSCLQVVVACLLTQMNYLNKSLDLFNTAIVSPIYYVMFTLLTIIASVIMFQVCLCGGAGSAAEQKGSACLPCPLACATVVLCLQQGCQLLPIQAYSRSMDVPSFSIET